MDAKEYDRIADLLMQIRKKIKKIDTTTKKAEWIIQGYIKAIDNLLIGIDDLGQADSKGWL